MKENFTRYGEAAVQKFEDKNLSTTISIKATDIQLLDMMLLLFCFKLVITAVPMTIWLKANAF